MGLTMITEDSKNGPAAKKAVGPFFLCGREYGNKF